MIQRKQSLYLLVVAVLMVIFQFSDIARITQPTIGSATIEQSASMSVWKIELTNNEPISMIYFGIMSTLASVLSLLTIFLYKNRTLQLRLCYVLGVVVLGVILFDLYYAYELYNSGPFLINFSLVILFPLLALPLIYLAGKGVIKDIALLKSYDRIR